MQNRGIVYVPKNWEISNYLMVSFLGSSHQPFPQCCTSCVYFPIETSLLTMMAVPQDTTVHPLDVQSLLRVHASSTALMIELDLTTYFQVAILRDSF